MNVHAGASRIGLETLVCSTCHSHQNSELMHGPPGAHVWALAPLSMTWWQRSSGEVCRQLKDKERNGGRSIKQIAEHIAHDELVHWGWKPGPGREPAPYSALEVAQFVLDWGNTGAPCPKK